MLKEEFFNEIEMEITCLINTEAERTVTLSSWSRVAPSRRSEASLLSLSSSFGPKRPVHRRRPSPAHSWTWALTWASLLLRSAIITAHSVWTIPTEAIGLSSCFLVNFQPCMLALRSSKCPQHPKLCPKGLTLVMRSPLEAQSSQRRCCVASSQGRT